MYLSDGNDRVVEMAKITHELSKKEEIIAQLSEEIQKYRESDATNGKSGWKGHTGPDSKRAGGSIPRPRAGQTKAAGGTITAKKARALETENKDLKQAAEEAADALEAGEKRETKLNRDLLAEKKKVSDLTKSIGGGKASLETNGAKGSVSGGDSDSGVTMVNYTKHSEEMVAIMGLLASTQVLKTQPNPNPNPSINAGPQDPT